MLSKSINENLFAGYGFGKDKRNVLGIIKKEATIETPDTPDLDMPKADLGGSTEPPIGADKMNAPELPKEEEPKEPKKPEKPKAKSKDWEELVSEVTIYIDQASLMIGDELGEQKIKILDKLYDTIKTKFSGTPEDIDGEVGEEVGKVTEKKKLKEKKK